MNNVRFKRTYRAGFLKDDLGLYFYHGPEIEFKKGLGDRFVLSLGFSRVSYSRVQDVIYPHLIVYRENLWRRKPWSKEGSATGPAGFRTWEVLREIWPLAEEKIKEHLVRKDRRAELVISGASDKLFKIYGRFLRGRRGYEFYHNEIVLELPRV